MRCSVPVFRLPVPRSLLLRERNRRGQKLYYIGRCAIRAPCWLVHLPSTVSGYQGSPGRAGCRSRRQVDTLQYPAAPCQALSSKNFRIPPAPRGVRAARLGARRILRLAAEIATPVSELSRKSSGPAPGPAQNRGPGHKAPTLPYSYGAPSRIRTCDHRIRSPVLYPAELWAQQGYSTLNPSSFVKNGKLLGRHSDQTHPLANPAFPLQLRQSLFFAAATTKKRGRFPRRVQELLCRAN